MIEPKLEVPAELRDLAEKTIDQAEKAFGMFFDAASKSIASVPNPGTEISKQALSFTEQRTYAADHRRDHVRRKGQRQTLIRRSGMNNSCPQNSLAWIWLVDLS